MALSPGTKINFYEILAFVGAGGMGEVYRARDTKLRREVAIKVLPEELSRDKERLARFEREARLLASLNHANIATLHGLEESDGARFLVMEFVPGETLAEKIARAPLAIDEALSVFAQIAAALEAAHEKGVVHRDLKPANVKVTPKGQVKVLDFGLAKALGDGSPETDLSQSPTLTRPTATGVILGTAPYMSPEQARGKAVDPRTDIWAFGCCLYEALVGRSPFVGETLTDTFARILEREADWDALPETAPTDVQMLVKRCLRKDLRRRLQHIGDARVQMEDALAEPGPESPPSVSVAEGASGRWRRWLPALAAGALLLAALAVTFLGPRPRPSMEIRQQQLTANPIENPVVSAAISPDGKYLAYADLTGLFLRLTNTGETHPLPLPEGFQIVEVDWFPDGTNLLFNANVDGVVSLWKIPILGGNPRKLREGPWRAAVSPDGTRIAFLEAVFPVRKIYVMGPNGESPASVVEGGEGDSFWELAWSADGERLLFGRWHSGPGARGHTIESINWKDRASVVVVSDVRLFQSWRGALPFCWTPDGRLIYALREMPPNEASSNLWAVEIDAASGEAAGTPTRLTQLNGYNFKDISLTRNGRHLSYLLEQNQSDVYFGELRNGGALLTNARRLTLDDRDDRPSGWMRDSQEILFRSNRGGNWSLLKQDIHGTTAEALTAYSGGGEVSADGSWILYWMSHDLMRMPVVGGPPERVLTTGSVSAGAFRCGGTSRSGCVLGERDLERNQYVFTAFDPLTGKGEELTRVEDHPPFSNWDLSPDGTRVALVHNDGRVRLIELSTGKETELSREGWQMGETVSWSEDGKSLFIDGNRLGSRFLRKGLLHVTLDGEVHLLRQRPNEWHIYPVPSPDGRYLAFGVMVFSGNSWMMEDF